MTGAAEGSQVDKVAGTKDGVPRKIVGFHQDEEGHWVAELECGHGQHVRHDPPWMKREWVTTEEGRREHLGHELVCLKCGRDRE